MLKCTLICVGRLKTPYWLEAIKTYAQKLRHGLKIEEMTIKDADPALSVAERKNQEGERILAALNGLPPGRLCVALDEHGESLSSKDLAALLDKCALNSRQPCFIIGGPYGLSEAVLTACQRKISLSKLTFTHELAQVLLWEQLYRADSIIRGTGYHHE
ncbi:MAG: 23S rRNA (pseudouridine(1915)-N(3))-methyltransferase RlmH [Deltaproteobacteria bacterium]|jgi:23S rRNA (pseudouridine1915-N3)-methyltransferase|nr:23S rRNA (pseudouridine(1915)-N(3))-methyltransferase RlmH [Deltaproteobacteria bacterium]